MPLKSHMHIAYDIESLAMDPVEMTSWVCILVISEAACWVLRAGVVRVKPQLQVAFHFIPLSSTVNNTVIRSCHHHP
jgi:hypothetical protein